MLAKMAIAAALIIPGPALASDWWMIGSTGVRPARQLIFIDKDSIRPAGANAFEAMEDDYYETLAGGAARYVKSVTRYDCAQKAATLLSITAYGADDTIIESQARVPEAQAIAAAPGTSADQGLSFVCGFPNNAVQVADSRDPNSISADILKGM